MATDLASRIRHGVAIVAADSLSARQWEAFLASSRVEAGEGAWLAPNILPYRSWADALWMAPRETPCL